MATPLDAITTKLSCTILNEQEIMAMPMADQRDAHTNKSRWKERARQDAAYRAVRDALGIPYGIEHNDKMPPLCDQPEVTLFGGRKGAGKSNELAWWTSFYRVRGYDAISNMAMLNTYIMDDMTDVYALGFLWHNTPVFLDEMQMLSSTFEGPAHKTKLLLDFYSQLRKMIIPVYMTSAQPHRIYSAIETELTWYAKPIHQRYQDRRGRIRRWYPDWCHTQVKYYGPYPVRYPDIAQTVFEDYEDEDHADRWLHNHENGHTAESVWRASKINYSWETIKPGQLMNVSADVMRDKIHQKTVAEIVITDEAKTQRNAIIVQLLNMIRFAYLNPAQSGWEWPYIVLQMNAFADQRALEQFDPNYNYVRPTEGELRQTLELEANISPRTARLKLQDLMARYPHMFQTQDDEEEEADNFGDFNDYEQENRG